MWFILSIVALLCWSGSDLFSKIGCKDPNAKYSSLKMVVAVGVIMGLHAAYEIFIDGVTINFDILITYLPVSMLYILSMALGYLGLKYIELSISSPICNSSGALVAVICMIAYGITSVNKWQIAAVILVCIGVIGLGIVEYREDPTIQLERQKQANTKYTKSFLALALPIAYCILDAAGTFGDSLVLEKLTEKYCLQQSVAFSSDDPSAACEIIRDSVTNSANVAYELTFLICGIICAIFVFLIKRDKPVVKHEVPKYVGACFETAGQLAYIFAISNKSTVMFAAPIISSYCAVSVLWSRIFLKEKLSFKHYIMIALTIIGIIIIGLFDEME